MDLYNAEFNCRTKPVSLELLTMLQAYHWPGNIRQLENLIKRYVIMGSEDVISCELVNKDQRNHVFGQLPEVTLGCSISLKKATKAMVRDFERQIITKMLHAHRWNRVQAARALNISYRALLYKVKESRLTAPQESSGSEQ